MMTNGILRALIVDNGTIPNSSMTSGYQVPAIGKVIQVMVCALTTVTLVQGMVANVIFLIALVNPLPTIVSKV